MNRSAQHQRFSFFQLICSQLHVTWTPDNLNLLPFNISPEASSYRDFTVLCMTHHHQVENKLVSLLHQLLHTGVSGIYLPQLSLLSKRAPNQLVKCHYSLKDPHQCHQLTFGSKLNLFVWFCKQRSDGWAFYRWRYLCHIPDSFFFHVPFHNKCILSCNFSMAYLHASAFEWHLSIQHFQ